MKAKQPGFYITGGKGFHVVFRNDWTISVQFGPGNYCDNYDAPINSEGFKSAGERGSMTAEVAAWGPDGNMIDFGGDTVLGRQSPEQVLALMNDLASR
jgi:hypothetical protein